MKCVRDPKAGNANVPQGSDSAVAGRSATRHSAKLRNVRKLARSLCQQLAPTRTSVEQSGWWPPPGSEALKLKPPLGDELCEGVIHSGLPTGSG